MKFMLTDEDILKLSQVFATKEDIKEITENLITKADFVDLQASVDAYAKKADTYFAEMVALSRKVDRRRREKVVTYGYIWLHMVADWLPTSLE